MNLINKNNYIMNNKKFKSTLAIVLILIISSCDKVIVDPGSFGKYFINNQSSVVLVYKTASLDETEINVGNNKIIEERGDIGFGGLPPSEGIGDLILYRDSSGIEIEALILLYSPDFDSLWSEEKQSDNLSHYTLEVTDDMIN
jgi:hypothetical protein